MSSKLVTKIVLDIAMSILFVFLLDAFGTGLTFHEIAGLFIFALFSIHILLNWSWVKNTTLNLLQSKLKNRTAVSVKMKYALNLAIFISISIIVITGVLISKVLFPSDTTHGEWIYLVHKWTSYICLGFLITHLVIHASYFVKSVGRIIINLKERNVRKTLVRLGAACLLVVMLYTRVLSTVSASDENQLGKITETQITTSPSTSQNRTDSPTESQYNENITYSEGSVSDNDDSEDADTIVSANDAATDATVGDTTGPEEKISLDEYLSQLHCNGCHKNCSLLYPQCDKAQGEIRAAEQDYQELYGI
ncbi:ferric reductase-like transmembrane domain-containing protein [Dehalobacter sp. TBBPA1]|uniref:ferric reductase-like transmembrane domain-containing protein n=1 Tax=Dehalobacter sp. TBBPA1 TaxID=3235037 RepID=UPI0034A4BECA